MSRLKRRKWTADKFGILASGGLLDAFDNGVKGALRLTDDEMDYMAKTATDSELDLALKMQLTFKEKRELITFLNTKVYDRL